MAKVSYPNFNVKNKKKESSKGERPRHVSIMITFEQLEYDDLVDAAGGNKRLVESRLKKAAREIIREHKSRSSEDE